MVGLVAEQLPDHLEVLGQFHAGRGAVRRWRHRYAPSALFRSPGISAAIDELRHHMARIDSRLQHFAMDLGALRLPAAEAQNAGAENTAEEQQEDEHEDDAAAAYFGRIGIRVETGIGAHGRIFSREALARRRLERKVSTSA